MLEVNKIYCSCHLEVLKQKVAELLERKFIGIDISEEYCEIANKRLQQETLIFDNYSNIRNSDAFTELDL